MKYHLVTAALLIVAIALYMAGFSGGGIVLLAMGVTFEAWFWIRAVRGKPSVRSKAVRS